MEVNVELELTDVFGGDGAIRFVADEKQKLTRTKKTTQTKKSVGVAVSDELAEAVSETKQENIATFYTENGAILGTAAATDSRPVLRLGGSHGKLWGALKSAAQRLRAQGNKNFTAYYAIIEGVRISPVNVPLEIPADGRVEVRQLSQELMGGRGGMIFPKSDVVSKCTVHVSLSFPDEFNDKVKMLMAEVCRSGGVFNKRRTQVVVKSVELCEEEASADIPWVET